MGWRGLKKEVAYSEAISSGFSSKEVGGRDSSVVKAPDS